MNIIEAVSSNLENIIELTDTYVARIYIRGKIKYKKPVDIRLEKIHIPLRLTDIQFIYDNEIKPSNVHKTDAILSTYFPEGSEFIISDGAKLRVLNYTNFKTYNNSIYVDMNCILVDDKIEIIENINSDQIKEKVKDELNNIIESNEIVKHLLPQYSYNLLSYNDDELNAINKFNSTKILKIIDEIDFNEREYILKNIASSNEHGYGVNPTSISYGINELAEIYNHDRILAGFCNVHSLYNPRYVFEWLIYIIENNKIIDETLLDELYLVNSIGTNTKLKITKNNNDYEILFITPNESNFDYKLIINNCISTGPYIKYSIDSIQLFKIEKIAKTEIELTNVKNQIDNLRCITEIFGILSCSNFNNMTLSEYYQNIDTFINEINIKSLSSPVAEDNQLDEEENG